MAFRSTSPWLLDDGKPATLRECPVGMILRDAPYTYEALSAYGGGEFTGFDLAKQSQWTQAACRVIGSEKARHREMEDEQRKAKSASAYGARVRSGRG